MNSNVLKKSSPSRYSGETAVKEADRRTSDRQMFTATAEVIETVTGARFSTRTMDLSPGGCFIDTTNPLPVGSHVRVKLSKGKGDFQTGGAVVYSQFGLGMGIAFSDLAPEQQEWLRAWLTGSATERPFSFDPSPKTKAPETVNANENGAVARVLRLLVTKGLLTEAEAASVLHEPVL